MVVDVGRHAAGAEPVRERSAAFARFAGLCGILTAAAGFLYAVAFLVLHSVLLSGLFLLLAGLLTIPVLVGLYDRLRLADVGFATLAVVLGAAGAIGSAVHGGYDLANALHPPASLPQDLPNPIDPRGLMTFGVAGLALAMIAWLMRHGGGFPRGLANLGFVAAGLLVLLYLGRLIVLDATNPLIVVPALISGFLVNPVFYLGVGLTLRRGEPY
jgi:hypothetical protein